MSPTRKDAANQPEPLLPRVAAGERGAVELCLQRYGRLVWSAARKFLGQVADAEDVVQEVFADLWTKADRFDPASGSEGAWVMMITRRRLIDRVRRESRRPQLGSLDSEPLQQTDSLEVADREDLSRAREALETLKPQERSVLELILLGGHSHRTAAEQLQLPLGTVKTHARRGLIALKERLGVQPLSNTGGERS